MKTDINVVVIGGGSGLSVVLRGIKKLTDNITAIVTMADNGGSSGRLRENFGILPPGDIRNCIISLSEAESVMQNLMQHRFKDEPFKDHSLGNLIIAGLIEMTGSFENALEKVHDIFAVNGKVLPVTLSNINLVAELEDGSEVFGEAEIPDFVKAVNKKIVKIKLKPENVMTTESVMQSIKSADIIMLGPGSLYTSVIPNLLTKDLAECIKKSNAKTVYCCNLVTQPGETNGYNVYEHVEAVRNHAGDIIDTIFVNSGKFDDEIYQRYLEMNSTALVLDDEQRRKLSADGIDIVEEDFLDVRDGYARHDADKIAEKLVETAKTRIFSKTK